MICDFKNLVNNAMHHKYKRRYVMKLGFLTNYSEDEVKFAAEVGFTSLSLAAGPGSALDAQKLTPKEAEQIHKTMEAHGLVISAIGHYSNPLHPDKAKRKEESEYLLKAMDVCKMLGVGVFTCFPGGGEGVGVEKNVALFKEVWLPIVEKASKNGVKIAFENCPGGGGVRPVDWDAMFDAIPGETIGLEFDPSHLFWQGIDYIKAVRDYGDRIYHIHAKDTEIIDDVLAREGILGHGWWRFRIPGWGDIDWQEFISTLIDVGYDWALSIEHEDPVFHGERRPEGLILGFKHLSQFICL
ncbi:sugar phosphate isomerase/epimerase [candidate division KSB1 bacterium]|nr:MAG: sugar phosphate isomerase/epimerase [candidate division KSB1 bacterium]